MTISAIMNAINYGYNAKTILSHVAKKFPKYAKPIDAALTYGFPAAAILKKIVNPKSSGADTDDFLTEHERTLKNYKRQKTKAVGQLAAGIAGVAALGAGAAGLIGRGAATAAQGVSNQLTHQPTTINVNPIPPGGPGAPSGASPTSGLPLVIPQTTPAQPNAPSGGGTMQGIINQGLAHGQKTQVAAQPAQPISPKQAVTPVTLQADEKRVLEQFPQVVRFIDSHLAKGKSPEEIQNLISSSKAFHPIVESFEKIRGTPFSAAIQDRASPAPVKTELPLQMKGPTPKKADVVITPFGAGSVHKVHGKDAYVEVNKKLQKVPIEEIEEPEPDVIKAVNDILQIPEEDRSSNVSLFTYDPSESKMYIQFHNGETYKYLDVDPKDVYAVAEKAAIPITQGENVYGAWSPEDKKSLGAALWKYFLSNPKYAKSKKDQPANPNYMKLDTLYDYWKDLRKKPKRNSK